LDSRHSSVAPSFYEEAITPESAKDSARYRNHSLTAANQKDRRQGRAHCL
jgi:hypothetical protein